MPGTVLIDLRPLRHLILTLETVDTVMISNTEKKTLKFRVVLKLSN